jgi:hypothetical protein
MRRHGYKSGTKLKIAVAANQRTNKRVSNCRVRVALHLAVHSNAVSQKEENLHFFFKLATNIFFRLNEEGPEENGRIGRGFFVSALMNNS